MRESVTLNAREQQRSEVVGRWLAGILTTGEAVRLLGCSERTAWRLRAAMLAKGAAGLAHGNRSRRERMAQEGLMIQVDGSRHDWLEGRGPWLTLVGGIDDATGKVVGAVFREAEDGVGYLLVLRDTARRFGLPASIYRDGSSVFAPTHGGARERAEATQVARALAELGITSIPAGSPQAKGRIERAWGTFQDRLVSELRRRGSRDLAAANGVLRD